ncbi:MAG TPA: RNA polymerase sigma factor [Planctomycetota bacterium]|nr:RNA polymerase sigma factor [Planctomycetota bacterium]
MERRHPLLDRLDAFVGFVRKRVGDDDLAADIVQEALAKALAHEDDLRDDDRLVAWFYRILRNTIADVMSRRSHEQRRSVPVSDDGEFAASDDGMAAVCACLGDAIRILKPEYADVLLAVELGGESTEAAAARLGITANNLKVRRHRAREALREQLQATCRMCATHGCVDCHCRSSSDDR